MFNINELEKELKNCLNQNYGLDVQNTIKENNYIDLEVDLSLPYCDDDIILYVSAFIDGRLVIDFMFDKLNLSFKTMKLINEINLSLSYIKCFVDENNYFHIQSNVSCNDSIDMFVNNLQDAIDTIIWDKAEKLIKPVTDLTFNEIEE